MGAFRVLTFTGQPVGMLSQISSASFMPKRGGLIEFSLETPVIVTGTSVDGQVAFDLIAKPDMQASKLEIETFKTLVMEAIQTEQSRPTAFEKERFTALEHPEPMASWALMHLSFPVSVKIDIYRRGARERIRMIAKEIGKRQ